MHVHLLHSLASVTVAAVLLLSLPCDALAHGRPSMVSPFGAECRIAVHGSQAVAHCHNPNAETDRVRLHVECERWWDLDTDSAPADTGPAETVRLTGRCWMEIRAAWVSHQKQGS